ncbi:hypothetical protein MSSAC_3978 [Methanosarcina siciliae C2J]|uniref:Uncharacterized protein n=3 Tax=Methanosarcina siciliae TaxID=38027 RepID=A0A0E3PHB6_9EURY|nr:hypothetical protein MSSIT_3566 [Methanosarcina siciliae T4/M]AKB34193.1 hypothetical protein MSSIH_3503 [Methanosarcina siciliae HI350]AKB38568.1 hypothetical protein MSSAC_3978 [Methanosarcina siciliae C2J]
MNNIFYHSFYSVMPPIPLPGNSGIPYSASGFLFESLNGKHPFSSASPFTGMTCMPPKIDLRQKFRTFFK